MKEINIFMSTLSAVPDIEKQDAIVAKETKLTELVFPRPLIMQKFQDKGSIMQECQVFNDFVFECFRKTYKIEICSMNVFECFRKT